MADSDKHTMNCCLDSWSAAPLKFLQCAAKTWLITQMNGKSTPATIKKVVRDCSASLCVKNSQRHKLTGWLPCSSRLTPWSRFAHCSCTGWQFCSLSHAHRMVSAHGQVQTKWYLSSTPDLHVELNWTGKRTNQVIPFNSFTKTICSLWMIQH